MLILIMVIIIILIIISICNDSGTYHTSTTNKVYQNKNKEITNSNLNHNNCTTNNFIIQDYEIMLEDDFSITDYKGRVYYKDINSCNSNQSTIYVTDENGDMYTIYTHHFENNKYQNSTHTNNWPNNYNSWYDNKYDGYNSNDEYESYTSNNWYEENSYNNINGYGSSDINSWFSDEEDENNSWN